MPLLFYLALINILVRLGAAAVRKRREPKPEPICATCSFAQSKIDAGEPAAEILSLAGYFCRSARMRIDHHFAGTSENADKSGYALTQELLAGKHEELRRGIV